MVISLKWAARPRNLVICLIFAGILIGFSPVFESRSQEADAVLVSENLNRLATIQGNSLLPMVNFSVFSPESRPTRKIKVVVTAYSSTPWETWGDPFVTAAGTQTREGIIANNLLPFGTQVRLPELYGNKVFVVEDRMNSRKGYYHVDIWLPSYWEALNFGAKTTYLEILEN